MKTTLLPALLLFCSCSTHLPQTVLPEPEKIRSVTITRAGGQMGFRSHLVFTADSVYYQRAVNMAPENNDSFRRANTSEAWQALTGDLQLDSFRNAVDGPKRAAGR